MFNPVLFVFFSFCLPSISVCHKYCQHETTMPGLRVAANQWHFSLLNILCQSPYSVLQINFAQKTKQKAKNLNRLLSNFRQAREKEEQDEHHQESHLWALSPDESLLLTVCETQEYCRILCQVYIISYGRRLLQVHLILHQYTLIQ